MNDLPPAAVAGSGAGSRSISARIQRNWQALDSVSQGALTGAVVKADAYGLGIAAGRAGALTPPGRTSSSPRRPTRRSRSAPPLPEAHIFVLDGLFPGAADALRAAPADAVPLLAPDARGVADALRRRATRRCPAALHFDTGMNRLGFRLNEASIVKRMIDQLGYEPQMVMSHFACADQPQHEKNRTQLALFQAVIAQFPGIPASLSNSAGMMTGREHHFQMVRPGIALYGGRAVNGRRTRWRRS